MSGGALPVYRCPTSGAWYFVARKSPNTYGVFTRSPYINHGKIHEISKRPHTLDEAVEEIVRTARDRKLKREEKMSL